MLSGRSPRVDTQPDSVDSYGPEAIELMRRAGMPLDVWQEDSITAMLAVREDGRWACFEYCEWVSRQNGKGCLLEARALAGLLLLGERLIMWSAHEYKTAMESFRRVIWLVGRLGMKVNDNLYDLDGVLLKVINTNGEESVERLDTGARIKFVARSKGSGRGFSGDVNLIDETFAYTFVQQAALMPTMSARPNPQIVYTSSPPLTGDTGEVMYLLRRRGDPTAPRSADDGPWEQDPSLGYRDWGLGGDLDFLDGIDLDDLATWAAANPALGIRISAEHVRRERRSMPAEDFARERLGVWPRQLGGDDGGWRVIAENAWLARLDRAAVMDDPIALAVHVSPDREWAGIVAAGPRAAGGRVVDVIERIPTGRAVARLAELAGRHQPVAVVVGDKALGDAAEGAGLAVIRCGTADLVTAAGTLYDAVAGSDPDVWHLGQSELTAGVRDLAKRAVGDRWRWDEQTPGAYLVIGASLAVWALGTSRLHRPALQPFAMT